MTSFTVAGIVALLVLLIVFSEVVSAVIPLIIVLTFVPEREREALARLLATLDSSRRLRFWSALRLAVVMRRQELGHARDMRHNPYAHLEAHFARIPDGAPVNGAYPVAPGLDRQTAAPVTRTPEGA
ncbi:hypothetical protein [Actinoplanes rectilineatus]|uniref:hypothetical protein n=1 Tax=Actinoplanes rectilineatus TaxID=113571 RepID=UPI0005F2E33F|nr:hypothetical protein [Actinoplanes rectilineatus]